MEHAMGNRRYSTEHRQIVRRHAISVMQFLGECSRHCDWRTPRPVVQRATTSRVAPLLVPEMVLWMNVDTPLYADHPLQNSHHHWASTQRVHRNECFRPLHFARQQPVEQIAEAKRLSTWILPTATSFLASYFLHLQTGEWIFNDIVSYSPR